MIDRTALAEVVEDMTTDRDLTMARGQTMADHMPALVDTLRRPIDSLIKASELPETLLRQRACCESHADRLAKEATVESSILFGLLIGIEYGRRGYPA